MCLYYTEIEMMVFGFIGLGVLLFLLVLAKGAARLNIGPQWLWRFANDGHTLLRPEYYGRQRHPNKVR
jgi:hypothetical protein